MTSCQWDQATGFCLILRILYDFTPDYGCFTSCAPALPEPPEWRKSGFKATPPFLGSDLARQINVYPGIRPRPSLMLFARLNPVLTMDRFIVVFNMCP